MSSTDPKTGLPERLRALLEGIPGVRRVLVDDASAEVFLVCDPPGRYPPVQAAARDLLELHAGGAAWSARLHVSYVGAAPSGGRVRFEGLTVRHPTAGLTRASVRLEWNGSIHEGRAEAENSPAANLRACAQATLSALEATVEGRVAFDLVGVKTARIFDHEMVVVLIYVTDPSPGRRLLGTAIVTEAGAASAAVLAVLNATNRALGNMLGSPD